MKYKITAEINIDTKSMYDCKQGEEWFNEYVLNGQLELYSFECGDYIGTLINPVFEKCESGDIKEIFNYWRDKLSTKRSKLDSARKTKIKNALKSFSVNECKRAIDGNKSSKYHQEHGYKSINLIFRNNDKIEYFMGMAQDKDNWLSDAQVDAMARTGETYQELYKRLAGMGYKFNVKR